MIVNPTGFAHQEQYRTCAIACMRCWLRLKKGVFGCNLEHFQSDVDPCFLPARKDAFVRICTHVRGLNTRLQIDGKVANF